MSCDEHDAETMWTSSAPSTPRGSGESPARPRVEKAAADMEAQAWANRERSMSRDRAYQRREEAQKKAVEEKTAKLREEQERREKQASRAAEEREEEEQAMRAARVAAKEAVMKSAAEQMEKLQQQREEMKRAEAQRRRAEERGQGKRAKDEEAQRKKEDERKKKEDERRKENSKKRRERIGRERTEREQQEQQQAESQAREAAVAAAQGKPMAEMSFMERCRLILSLHELYMTKQAQGEVGGTRFLYQMLGVPPNSTEMSVKKQYRSMMMLFHPDKVPSERQDLAVVASQCINNAKCVLLGA